MSIQTCTYDHGIANINWKTNNNLNKTKQTKKPLHVLWKQTWKPGANAIGAAAIDMATVFVCDVL